MVLRSRLKRYRLGDNSLYSQRSSLAILKHADERLTRRTSYSSNLRRFNYKGFNAIGIDLVRIEGSRTYLSEACGDMWRVIALLLRADCLSSVTGPMRPEGRIVAVFADAGLSVSPG